MAGLIMGWTGCIRRAVFAAVAAAALVAASGGPARAACTASERVKLLEHYSVQRVDEFCGDAARERPPVQNQQTMPQQQQTFPQQFPQQQTFPSRPAPVALGIVCQARFGPCQMAQPGPLRGPCFCMSVFGPVPGFIR